MVLSEKEVVQVVDSLIGTHEWFAFTLSGCGWCHKLIKERPDIVYLDINNLKESVTFEKVVGQKRHYKQFVPLGFPAVFHKGKYVGGYDKVKKVRWSDE